VGKAAIEIGAKNPQTGIEMMMKMMMTNMIETVTDEETATVVLHEISHLDTHLAHLARLARLDLHLVNHQSSREDHLDLHLVNRQSSREGRLDFHLVHHQISREDHLEISRELHPDFQTHLRRRALIDQLQLVLGREADLQLKTFHPTLRE